jgi:hypothetical protein
MAVFRQTHDEVDNRTCELTDERLLFFQPQATTNREYLCRRRGQGKRASWGYLWQPFLVVVLDQKLTRGEKSGRRVSMYLRFARDDASSRTNRLANADI